MLCNNLYPEVVNVGVQCNDSGSSSVGAQKELKNAFKEMDPQKIQ